MELSRRAIVRGGVDGLKGSILYGRVAGWIKVFITFSIIYSLPF